MSKISARTGPGALRMRAIGVASVAALSLVALAACGSSSNNASGSTAASSGSSASSSSSTGATGGGSTGGGSGSTATGSPIEVGFANMDSGAINFAGADKGATAAEDWINAHGGIHGHPLKLDFCDLQNTVQATQACGQKFASNSAMPFALVTLNVFGNAGFDAAMHAAGKPVIGSVGITTTDLSDPGVYWMYGGNPPAYGAEANVDSYAATHGGPKKLSIIYHAGDQSTLTGIAEIKAQVQKAGMAVTEASFGDNSPDFLATVNAAKVSSDSILELNIETPAACQGVAQNLKELGIKPAMVMASASCVTPAILKANPDLYDGWYFEATVEDAFAPVGQNPPAVEQYIAAYNKYVAPGPVVTNGNHGWGVVMSAYNILEKAHYTTLTPAAVQQAVMSYKGPVPMSTGKLNCPGAAPYPAMCNPTALFYQAQNGVFVLKSPPGAQS